MAAKYSKAPISELVFGLNFSANSLMNFGIIFELLDELKKDYPIINTHPAIAQEEVIDGNINMHLDYGQSGFSVFRLSTQDSRWQILIQQNNITYHWKRADMENVGNYPGFDNALQRFIGIHSLVDRLFSKYKLTLNHTLKSYYLAYSDRVMLKEYLQKNKRISDIINLPAPTFSVGENNYLMDNYFCKYSTLCSDINGSAIIGINTVSVPAIGRLLIVDNKLKGIDPEYDIYRWFHKAHDIQVSFFENIFNDNILQSWK